MNKPIVDLGKIVADRAYKFYKDGRCFPKTKENLKITYDWSGVKFTPEVPVYHEEGNVTEISNVIFKSTFRNKNNYDQQQILAVKKETLSSVTTTLSKGFTTGTNLGLSVQAPKKITSVSVEFSKGYSVDNTVESVDQKTVTWSAGGKLKVAKKSIVTAELKIKERICSFNFSTRVAIEGKVKAVFHTLKNEFIMEYIGDMRSIVLIDKTIPDDLVCEEGDKVFLKVEGKSAFKYGIEQEIIVT